MDEFKVDGDVIAEVVAYLNGHKTAPAQRMADAVLRLLNRHYQDAVALEAAREDGARLDYIERTFSGMTNRERYLPVQMIWGNGCNGRTLREACDKYRFIKAPIDQARGKGGGEVEGG